MNQSKAYETVYGLNPNAYTIASELLRKPHVKAYLDSLNRRKEAVVLAHSTLEDRDLILSKAEKRQILAEIARARLVDFSKNGEPELKEDTPNARAAREFYHRKRLDRDGNPIVTKSIKLIDPIEAIREDNRMSGDYAPSKHLVGHVQLDVSFIDRVNRNEEEEETGGK